MIRDRLPRRPRSAPAAYFTIATVAALAAGLVYTLGRERAVSRAHQDELLRSRLEPFVQPAVVSGIVTQFVDHEPENIGEFLHRWRLLSQRYLRNSDRIRFRSELAILLDADRYRERYPRSAPLFYDAADGWTVRSFSEQTKRLGHQYESHVDQLLASCAEAGIPMGARLRGYGRDDLTLATLLHTSRRRFVAGQECAWSVVAYCTYLPCESSWHNRFGEICSYQAIGEQLLSPHDPQAPCAGTHRFYALAMLLGTSEQYGFLRRSTAASIRQTLREASMRLEQRQLASGAWGAEAMQAAPGLGTDPGERELLVTAHHLEWILAADPAVRPSIECLSRAVAFLVQSLRERASLAAPGDYCGASHGCCVLLGLMSKRSSTVYHGQR